MSDLNSRERVEWPTRAVVTAGMPYGNKPLALRPHRRRVRARRRLRALPARPHRRRRTSASSPAPTASAAPINEGYRKLEEAGEFDGTIADYVRAQPRGARRRPLTPSSVSLDIYEGTGIGHAGDVHQMISDQFIEQLARERPLAAADATLQFYDAEAGTFLNGRQVVRAAAPCRAASREHAYADECDLGHQLRPRWTSSPRCPRSRVPSPEMRPGGELVFRPARVRGLPEAATCATLEADDEVRLVVTKAIAEFLAPPVIFVKNEHLEEYEAMAAELPPHRVPSRRGQQAILRDRVRLHRRARRRPRRAGCGRPALPHLEDARALPHHRQHRVGRARSRHRRRGGAHGVVLARIAVGAHLVHHHDQRRAGDAAHELARLLVLRRRARSTSSSARTTCTSTVWPSRRCGRLCAPAACSPRRTDSQMRQTTLVANHHMLFGKKKASSSGAVKPPTGEELLEHYTPEQLRAHFLALGLDQKSVGFSPKPFDPGPGQARRTRATPIRCSRRGRCSPTCSTASPAAASTRRRRISTAACPWAP